MERRTRDRIIKKDLRIKLRVAMKHGCWEQIFYENCMRLGVQLLMHSALSEPALTWGAEIWFKDYFSWKELFTSYHWYILGCTMRFLDPPLKWNTLIFSSLDRNLNTKSETRLTMHSLLSVLVIIHRLWKYVLRTLGKREIELTQLPLVKSVLNASVRLWTSIEEKSCYSIKTKVWMLWDLLPPEIPQLPPRLQNPMGKCEGAHLRK
jgi:transposase